MARLFVLSGGALGTTFDFDETSTVGRGDDADIQIPEASISRQHARLVPRDEAGAWKVIDLKSSNGVFVGGKRVASGIVRDGDTFRLGDVELRLRDEAADDADDAQFEEAHLEETRPGEDQLGGSEVADLEVAEPELEFGDEIELELELPDDEEDPATQPARPAVNVSRRSLDAPEVRPTARPARPGGATAVAGGGRPVLQYAARNHRSSGDDLAQATAGKKAAIFVLALAGIGGVAYGAFKLTQTARGQSAAMDEGVVEDGE